MGAPAQAPLPFTQGSPEARVEVDLLLCGESLSPPGWYYRQEAGGSWLKALGVGVPKEKWLRCPIGAFLVRHPDAGPFLIDTGLHPRAASNLRADFGLVNSRAFSTLRMRPEDAVSAQLRRRGLEPEQIKLVVMTHLHVDHTSGMPEYPQATFLCAAEEWQATRGWGAVMRGYVAGHLPEVSRVQVVDLDRGEPCGPFARTLDLFGDGSVRLISTPGHTPGHLSVLVRLSGGEALLAGDAIYTLRNLEESIIPWRTADDERFFASLAELREYTGQSPSVPIIATHDAQMWDEHHELR